MENFIYVVTEKTYNESYRKWNDEPQYIEQTWEFVEFEDAYAKFVDLKKLHQPANEKRFEQHTWRVGDTAHWGLHLNSWLLVELEFCPIDPDQYDDLPF